MKTKATRAPAFNPATLNPLIVEGSPKDTILGLMLIGDLARDALRDTEALKVQAKLAKSRKQRRSGAMTTTITEAERIAGAKRCVDVLLRAKKDIETITAAGNLSPQTADILRILTEFAINNLWNLRCLGEQLDTPEREGNVIPFPVFVERRPAP